MNPLDHPPPHFHARYGGYSAALSIESGRLIEGMLPDRVLRMLGEWHSLHKPELQENWRRFEAQLPMLPIAPLE